MSAQLNPYLHFKDNAREAMEFYQGIFGGDLTVNTFAEFHASDDPAEGDKVMHAQLNGDNGIVFMASDTPNGMDFEPGVSVEMSLSGDDHELLGNYFQKLSAGGTIIMPLEKAPWGDVFGGCKDRYGIHWMVNISPKA